MRFAESFDQTDPGEKKNAPKTTADSLGGAIEKGLSERATALAASLIKERDPLSLINEEIIPALDRVGKAFEEKRLYLPGLLMSAEAAKSAAEVIKRALPATDGRKCTIILATVKGDIHDIGKNIVKLLLENYGYRVIDLGKDVEPGRILEAAKEHNAPLVGLSALMTTTVPSMEKTIELIKENLPDCHVMVGGAVLSQRYADLIGADAYCRDALEAVKYAEGRFS